ncbi:MAG TPA: hypothetical protein VI704_06710, partial [Bacteroidota bacterium]|nr:hypothetical protein [Bacteroidota bacterium]
MNKMDNGVKQTSIESPVARNDDFSHAEIARFRDQTEGCKNVIHFNNAGASLMPDVVRQSVMDHIGLESRIGG